MTITIKEIQDARDRIKGVLPITPVTFSSTVSELIGHEVYFKWENKLRTGSFKERGALNFILKNLDSGRLRGVCAASAGNHALALSFHAAKYKVPCTIVMPSIAPLVKVQSTRNTGAEVIIHGSTFHEAYEKAGQIANERNITFVPGFDHDDIIAGQGTAGLELLDQIPDLDCLIVPIGGGGLMSGMALAIKSLKPSVYIIGVQSEWAVEVQQFGAPRNAGKLGVATVAEGIAIKSIGAKNSEIMRDRVDKLVVVSETEIAKGIIQFLEFERAVVEGAGAVGMAVLFRRAVPTRCKKAVVVVSGSNIDMNVLGRLIERDMGERGRLLQIIVSVPDRPGSLKAATGIIAQEGGNVLNVIHERSFSKIPGNVDITFMLEVRDDSHKKIIIQAFENEKIGVTEVT